MKDSKKSCGSTVRPNSETTRIENSSAPICPVSNCRTGTDCSHLRHSSSVVTVPPSHSSMASTPLSCTSTPPTSNSKTRISFGGLSVFILVDAADSAGEGGQQGGGRQFG